MPPTSQLPAPCLLSNHNSTIPENLVWVEGGARDSSPPLKVKNVDTQSRPRADTMITPGRKRKLKEADESKHPARSHLSGISSPSMSGTCNPNPPSTTNLGHTPEAFLAESPKITGTSSDMPPNTCLVKENCLSLAASPSLWPNIPARPPSPTAASAGFKHPTELNLGLSTHHVLGVHRTKVRRILSIESSATQSKRSDQVVPIPAFHVATSERCTTPEELIIKEGSKRCPPAPGRQFRNEPRDDAVPFSPTQGLMAPLFDLLWQTEDRSEAPRTHVPWVGSGSLFL